MVPLVTSLLVKSERKRKIESKYGTGFKEEGGKEGRRKEGGRKEGTERRREGKRQRGLEGEGGGKQRKRGEDCSEGLSRELAP